MFENSKGFRRQFHGPSGRKEHKGKHGNHHTSFFFYTTSTIYRLACAVLRWHAKAHGSQVLTIFFFFLGKRARDDGNNIRGATRSRKTLIWTRLNNETACFRVKTPHRRHVRFLVRRTGTTFTGARHWPASLAAPSVSLLCFHQSKDPL